MQQITAGASDRSAPKLGEGAGGIESFMAWCAPVHRSKRVEGYTVGSDSGGSETDQRARGGETFKSETQSELSAMLRAHIVYVAIAAVLVPLPAYAAERGASEEERIAPLVSKQNCWGGVIKYVLENHTFEVEDALCADGSFYHLEFDEELQLVEKRFMRKAQAK